MFTKNIVDEAIQRIEKAMERNGCSEHKRLAETSTDT